MQEAEIKFRHKTGTLFLWKITTRIMCTQQGGVQVQILKRGWK